MAQLDAVVQRVVGGINGSTGQVQQQLQTLETSLRDAAQRCRADGVPAATCANLDAGADAAASAP